VQYLWPESGWLKLLVAEFSLEILTLKKASIRGAQPEATHSYDRRATVPSEMDDSAKLECAMEIAAASFARTLCIEIAKGGRQEAA
jgi:hypothetical protein